MYHSTKKNGGSHVCSSQLLNLAVPTLLDAGSKAFNITKHQLFASSLGLLPSLHLHLHKWCPLGVWGDLSEPPGMMDPNWNSSGLGLGPLIVNGWTPTGWADETDVLVQKFAANIRVFSVNLCSPDLDYLSLKHAFPTDLGRGFSSLWPFFANKCKWPSCPSPEGWGSAVCLNLPVNATLTRSVHK